ncbi:MAG: AAA family ATPase [Pseudomonadota bacterium]
MRPEQFPNPPETEGVTVDAFAQAAAQAAEAGARLRGGEDVPPPLRRISLTEAARWRLGLTPTELRRALSENPALPRERPAENGLSRGFDPSDLAHLEAALAPSRRLKRPENALRKTLAVSNFKGGVGKTSVAAHLAICAAMDGLKILMVDLDSQGSLSGLFGGAAQDEWDTAWTLLARDYARTRQAAGLELDEDLAKAAAADPKALIQKTSWPDLDLIPAQLDLYWAEFQAPVWRMSLPAWRIWEGLEAGLAEAAEGYDLVVLDTPPALGHLTVNALAAADLLLVPFGASFLEIDSTGRFFDMLHATFASIEAAEGVRFEWDAVRCLLTRYDAAQQAELAALAEGWFGPLMARTRLDATALAQQAGEQAAPIHAADPADFNPATYRRGRAAFEAVWAEIRPLIETAWTRDGAEKETGFACETS